MSGLVIVYILCFNVWSYRGELTALWIIFAIWGRVWDIDVRVFFLSYVYKPKTQKKNYDKSKIGCIDLVVYVSAME